MFVLVDLLEKPHLETFVALCWCDITESVLVLLPSTNWCAGNMTNSLNEEDTTSLCSFGSRADLHRLSEAPMPSWIHVGEPVVVTVTQGGTRTGHIQFVGQTEFASGSWVGVELDSADGNWFCWISYWHVSQWVCKWMQNIVLLSHLNF